MAKDKPAVTTPDLVILSLLAERPMHGYEVNAELERRQARDWVAISRPQIYYSLEKLAGQGLLNKLNDSAPALGADRRVLKTSAKGRAVLARELERESWTSQRERPAFLTWLALSWQATPAIVKRQIQRRMTFLEAEISREEETLRDVREEVGHDYHEAVWMLKLTLEHLKSELLWLKQVAREINRRAPAVHAKEKALATNPIGAERSRKSKT
ncbi:MAG TPA: PadR family transcriptional regulator [Pyrinomonadaceae bacterium]|nr:PadR family transcriptional regulator [Pyrinomonadaceae bacterium]